MLLPFQQSVRQGIITSTIMLQVLEGRDQAITQRSPKGSKRSWWQAVCATGRTAAAFARRQQIPVQLEISLRRMPAWLHPKQPTVRLHQMKLECCNTINQHPCGLLVSLTPKFQGNLLSSVVKGILLGLGQLSG